MGNIKRKQENKVLEEKIQEPECESLESQKYDKMNNSDMESSTVEDKFYKTPIANMKKIEDEGPETKDESGSNCTPVTGFEFATCNGVEKKKEENGSDSQKKEERIQIAKVDLKHSKESSNESGFVTKKNNDENVDRGFLSRDEAI